MLLHFFPQGKRSLSIHSVLSLICWTNISIRFLSSVSYMIRFYLSHYQISLHQYVPSLYRLLPSKSCSNLFKELIEHIIGCPLLFINGIVNRHVNLLYRFAAKLCILIPRYSIILNIVCLCILQLCNTCFRIMSRAFLIFKIELLSCTISLFNCDFSFHTLLIICG